jgi:hypothetical protein
MAVTESSSQISYRALSVALIGGLLVSTFFTLVFVPILFTLFDDVRVFFLRAMGAILGKNRRTVRLATPPCGD